MASPLPASYLIKVKGQLDHGWEEWLEGMTISLTEDGDTELTGVIPDQAALYGILNRLRDLNLTLVEVNRLE
jgi:hypothetical protein